MASIITCLAMQLIIMFILERWSKKQLNKDYFSNNGKEMLIHIDTFPIWMNYVKPTNIVDINQARIYEYDDPLMSTILFGLNMMNYVKPTNIG